MNEVGFSFGISTSQSLRMCLKDMLYNIFVEYKSFIYR